MDARNEIARCRREADTREYQAIELRARARALEARDATYRLAMEDGGHPVVDRPGWFERARVIWERVVREEA